LIDRRQQSKKPPEHVQNRCGRKALTLTLSLWKESRHFSKKMAIFLKKIRKIPGKMTIWEIWEL